MISSSFSFQRIDCAIVVTPYRIMESAAGIKSMLHESHFLETLYSQPTVVLCHGKTPRHLHAGIFQFRPGLTIVPLLFFWNYGYHPCPPHSSAGTNRASEEEY